MNLADDIKQKAIDLGFDLVGITDASPIDARQTEFLADWLINHILVSDTDYGRYYASISEGRRHPPSFQ